MAWNIIEKTILTTWVLKPASLVSVIIYLMKKKRNLYIYIDYGYSIIDYIACNILSLKSPEKRYLVNFT